LIEKSNKRTEKSARYRDVDSYLHHDHEYWYFGNPYHGDPTDKRVRRSYKRLIAKGAHITEDCSCCELCTEYVYRRAELRGEHITVLIAKLAAAYTLIHWQSFLVITCFVIVNVAQFMFNAGERRNSKGDGPRAIAAGFKKRGRRRKKGTREPSYGQIYTKVARDVSWLMSVVNVEDKYIDINTAVTSTTTGAFVLLNGMGLGDTAITRNGQSIKGIKLSVNGSLTQAVTSNQYERIMVFYDKQCNAAAPIQTDLLTGGLFTFRNISQLPRFHMLMDEMFSVSSASPTVILIDRSWNLNQHTIYNTGVAGTVADITNNSLYFFHISNDAANGPTLVFNTRFLFTDN
jgi:hypothetical protein